MSEEDTTRGHRYAYSRLTDTWYRVYDWEEGEGNNITNTGTKEEVPEEEVPENVLKMHNALGEE